MSDERRDTLGRAIVTRREARDKAKKEWERLKTEFEETQADFWDLLDDEGITTITLDLGPGFGKVQFQKRETVKGIVKDPAKAEAAVEEAGLEAELLGERKVRQKVLSEYMRDWIASGQPIPEGLDFTATRYVSITRK